MEQDVSFATSAIASEPPVAGNDNAEVVPVPVLSP